MPRYIDSDVLRTKMKDLGIRGKNLEPTKWDDIIWMYSQAVSETPTADVCKGKKEK